MNRTIKQNFQLLLKTRAAWRDAIHDKANIPHEIVIELERTYRAAFKTFWNLTPKRFRKFDAINVTYKDILYTLDMNETTPVFLRVGNVITL